MRVAVTGSSGFLGKALCKVLDDAGDDIVRVDRRHHNASWQIDLAYPYSLDPLVLAFKDCEEVYHLAGALGTTELDARIPAAIADNVSATCNVLEAARRAGVKRFFLPSKPNVWRNTYTITKQCAEDFALLYAERGWLDVAVLRYFNLFGPGQALLPVRKIIPCFAAHAVAGLPLPVYGSGTQQVDLIDVADAARLTFLYTRCSRRKPVAVCDLGRGLGLPVLHVAKAVNGHVGNEAGIRFLPMRGGETPDTSLVADLEGLRRAVGDLNLGDGSRQFEKALDYYKALPRPVIDEAVAHYEANP